MLDFVKYIVVYACAHLHVPRYLFLFAIGRCNYNLNSLSFMVKLAFLLYSFNSCLVMMKREERGFSRKLICLHSHSFLFICCFFWNVYVFASYSYFMFYLFYFIFCASHRIFSFFHPSICGSRLMNNWQLIISGC